MPSAGSKSMGKTHKGINEKALEARIRKEQVKVQKREAEEKAKEDAYWREAGEGAISKAQAKRLEKAKQREETLAKKQEAKRQHDEELESIANSLKKTQEKWRYDTRKVTHHELLMHKEKEEEMAKQQASEAELASRREVTEDDYAAMLAVGNRNVDDSVSASGIDAAVGALEALGVAPPTPQAPMTFKQFFERELPGLKEDKPYLKLPQYKDIAFKMWQRSPENPTNQR